MKENIFIIEIMGLCKQKINAANADDVDLWRKKINKIIQNFAIKEKIHGQDEAFCGFIPWTQAQVKTV